MEYLFTIANNGGVNGIYYENLGRLVAFIALCGITWFVTKTTIEIFKDGLPLFKKEDRDIVAIIIFIFSGVFLTFLSIGLIWSIIKKL